MKRASFLSTCFLLLLCSLGKVTHGSDVYSSINGALCISTNSTETRGPMSDIQCAFFCSDKQSCQAFSVADGPCQLFVFDRCSKSVRNCSCSRRGQVFVKQRTGLQPGALCPSGYGDGLCGVKYKVTSSTGTWQSQLATCQAESGSLVIMADVTDAVEMSQINSICSKYAQPFFLGGFQIPGSAEPAGGWYWVACNATVDPSLWRSGEPNNAGGIENAVLKSYADYPNLADVDDSATTYYGLCECLSPFD